VKTPLELVQTLLSNSTNIEHVRGLTTEDVTYVSLSFNNPELHKVLPWTGINRGPQSIVDVFNGIGRVWETKAFEVKDVIANEHSVAMFGSFTYKTRTLGKEITSPFALLAKVTGDKISYIRHMALPWRRNRRRSQRGVLMATLRFGKTQVALRALLPPVYLPRSRMRTENWSRNHERHPLSSLRRPLVHRLAVQARGLRSRIGEHPFR
jgi:ketosteroid isomerase-like protein